MGIILALIAGIFGPLTNLCLRKSVDVGGTAKPYFVIQMASSLFFALLLGPVRAGDYSIPLSTALFGIIAGLVLSVMLFALGKAIEKGPPGFTFAILNSATVMPGLLMAIVFDSAFGFLYNGWHAIGSLLVLSGIFWGVKGLKEMGDLRKWILFSASMFALHILLLCLFQGRAMMMNLPHPEELASFFTKETMKSEWFMPFFFLTSGLVQLSIFLKAGASIPKAGEVFYGIAGGFTNLLCTTFLLWATIKATPIENAVIFPIYSVIGIVLTNFWGQKLYQEQVNWRACQISLCGLFIGTVDWAAVTAFIGF